MGACPTCHTDADPGARYCASCGAGLDQPRPVEGERKFATVLFADVAGSTTLAERLDPEEWAAIMNGAFGFMNAAVARYGGTVSRLMGDAVLALFGAPTAHEDDPERAVRAALDIRAASLSYARTVADRHGVEFGVRVGVNTGMAVLAVLGDGVRAEYTAMGDTANVAARLQSEARAGSVLISGETERLVRGLFELRPRGRLTVRGRRAAIEAYEVVAAVASVGKPRGVEGFHSPLVGRETERDRLREALDALSAGRGGVVAVLGEAGLGKSRLLAELREEAERSRERITWLEARGISYGQSLVYHPWQQIGRQFIGAAEGDGPDPVREKVEAFADRVGAPPEAVPLYNAMLGVDTAEDRRRLSSVDADVLVDRIADAVVGAIRAAMAAEGAAPCVLVFDDLHWSDVASLDLIGRVAELTTDDRLLLICLLRPESDSAACAMVDRLEESRTTRFARIDLRPLSRHVVETLFDNLVGPDVVPAATRSLISERSEGNPFFLEEILRALVDGGHLEPDGGGWRVGAEIETVVIPETLVGVLAARIDALPDEAKRVAQTAAVLGRTFPYRVLDAVCEAVPPPTVHPVDPHLDTLVAEELIRERTGTAEREYIFKHALTQESAYRSLLIARRREIHAVAGRCLESLYPDRVASMAPLLAHHFERGGEPVRAGRYSMQAAAAAMRLSAVREAMDHYDRAYTAFTDAADSLPVDRVDAVLGWVRARHRLKEYDGAEERLQEAEALAREIDDRRRLARVLSWMGALYMLQGRPSRSTPYLVESNALGKELGDDELMLLPFFFATDELVDRDPRRAAEQLDRVVELSRRYDVPEIEGHALAVKAVAHARRGEYPEARAAIAEALEAAPSGGHKVKEADVHIFVGAAYYDMGELEKGLEHARIGAELAQAENAIECACAAFYGLGMTSLERAELEEAAGHLSRSLQLAEDSGWHGFVNRIRGGLAAVDLDGSGESGIREMESAIEAARSEGDDFTAAIVSERLALAHLRRGEAERAEAALDRSLEYYWETGMRAYKARALELSARIHDARGRRGEAARARRAAAVLRASFEGGVEPAEAGVPTPVRATA